MRVIILFLLISIVNAAIGQNVGIGTETPVEKLSVGNSSQFRINDAGNVTRINDVPTSFPAIQGANRRVLTNDGSGNLAWVDPVPFGASLFSRIENDASLLNAGYKMRGSFEVFNFRSYYGENNGSWLQLSVGANAPQPRYGHTAIWTGTEMIIWGGTNVGSSYPTTTEFLSIFKYNPTTNVWTKISTFNGTPPTTTRTGHTAVWTGTEMIIWGGRTYLSTGGVTPYNSGYKYNPTSNTWTSFTGGGGNPGARFNHCAVWTGSRMIIWGGNSATGAYYSPSLDLWFNIASGPSFESNVAAAWTGTEMIIWGNTTKAKYNPVTNTWVNPITGTTGGYASSGGNAVWTGTEVLFWGGTGPGGKYNPTTNTCEYIANSPGPPVINNGTAVWTGAYMLIYGGEHNFYPWVQGFMDYNFWRFYLTGIGGDTYGAKSNNLIYMYSK